MQKLQFAAMGGRGAADIKSLAGHPKVPQLMWIRTNQKTAASYPPNQSLLRLAKMLQEGEETIDIVSISTPDHMQDHGFEHEPW